MQGETVGEVVQSSVAEVPVGCRVRVGNGGWQRYVSVWTTAELTVLDDGGPSAEVLLGALGMPAVTAWHMVERMLVPAAGETLLVSAASGAVGLVAGQLGKARGARVIGLAGTPEKCERLRHEFGFDAVLNYREHPSADRLAAALAELAPDGIDCYADNVGGVVLNAAVRCMASNGRIAVCGRVAAPTGGVLEQPELILLRQLTIRGFIVPAEAFEPARAHLSRLLAEKRLRFATSMSEGLDSALEAFLGLCRAGSKHFGKQLVRIAE